MNIIASYGIKSRWQREKGKIFTFCSSIWLKNAYGSVPHSVLWAAFDFFPGANQNYKSSETLLPGSTVLPYNIRLNHKLATARGTEGIMAGCTISPFAFTMAMKVIIRASKWVVGGERLQCNQRLPPIRAYMDNLTTLTTTVPCTKRLLESFIKIKHGQG